MLCSIYHKTLNLLKHHIFGVKALICHCKAVYLASCEKRYYGCHYLVLLNI